MVINISQILKLFQHTVIILGAGVRADGNPCDLLADRLDTGAKLYVRRICKTILLTGDNNGQVYNELYVMKNWIMKYNLEIFSTIVLLFVGVMILFFP